MLRIITILAASFFIISLGSPLWGNSFIWAPFLTVSAQTDPYTQYLRSLNSYFTARTTFDNSKARYQSFNTLQSKETVTKDAVTMLQDGRSALTQYTSYLQSQLGRVESVNERVKSLITQDLQTHVGYLQSVENVLGETPSFTQINTHAQALSTRYGYVTTTSNQALLYTDAVRLHDTIRTLKQLLEKMSDLNRTLPDGTQARSIGQIWLETATAETSADEEAILKLIDDIYPQPTVSANRSEQRAFEQNTSTASQNRLNTINNQVINRIARAVQNYQIIKEGYQKL